MIWKPSQSPSNPAPVTTPSTEKPSMSTVPIPSSLPDSSRTSASSSSEQASIGKSLTIKGEVTGSESLFIDGRVEGSISLAGNRVSIGRNGTVTANITAREVVVMGKVKGNLNASDRVEIRNEGSLIGDVVAQRIVIEDGAYFKGGIDIRKPGQKGEELGREGKESGKMEPVSASTSGSAAARA